MRSPENQKTIQIELTNACPHKCSNCTRFCGHHKKPFFVEEDHFKDAVDSLKNFPHMVGIMGGEPTIHPRFDELVRYYRSQVYEPFPNLEVALPISDFGAYRNLRLSDVIRHRRGLWTSLGSGFAKHYGLIMDTFPYMCINTHEATGNRHQALLITREELNVPDDQWIKMRDECWIQNLWSACITPKGAFFCEVAGALDMLFDGPGGWDLDSDWWKRKPEDFGEQLKWCELCAAPLAVPRIQANMHLDVVSPKLYEMLKLAGSPKLLKHPESVQVFDPSKYDPEEFEVIHNSENYLPEDTGNSGRVSVAVPRELRVKKIEMVVVCENYDDYLNVTLAHNKTQVDEIYVVTSPEDTRTQECCERHDVVCIQTPRLHEDGAAFAKAKAVNDALAYLELKQWVILADADVVLKTTFRERLDNYILNPDALYFTRRWGPEWENAVPFIAALAECDDYHELFERWARKTSSRIVDRAGNDIEHYPYGYFQMFHYGAAVLEKCRETGVWYDEKFTTAEHSDMFFGRDMFPKGKIRSLPVPEFDVIHLPHGPYTQNWKGRKSPRIDDPNLEKNLAIVVPFCRLSDSRLYEWLAWNKHIFGKHRVYIVTDRKRLHEPENILQVIVSNLKQYDPAMLRNIGIREAVSRGAQIVLATDADCELEEGLIEDVLTLEDGQGRAPYHMMLECGESSDGAQLAMAEIGGEVEEDSHSIGTIALTANDWHRLNGYHEGMEGYGREDGDLYDRARELGILWKRDRDLVWHHWHECRIDPRWYPARTVQNASEGFRKEWSNPDWGKPE